MKASTRVSRVKSIMLAVMAAFVDGKAIEPGVNSLDIHDTALANSSSANSVTSSGLFTNPTKSPIPGAALDAAKKYVHFAWAAYYPGSLSKYDLNGKKDSAEVCFGRHNGISQNYFVPEEQLGQRSAQCSDEIDGWSFQGRVETTNTYLFGAVTGSASADIYHKGDSQCLVAIAGTNDMADVLESDVIKNGLWAKVGNRKVGRGFKDYYDLIRDKINEACAGRSDVIAVGHSLGGAAAEMAVTYGDAQSSYQYGNPKLRAMSTCPDDEFLHNSYSFYAVDETGVKTSIDPVASVGPALPVHCTNHYSITQVWDTRQKCTKKWYTTKHVCKTIFGKDICSWVPVWDPHEVCTGQDTVRYDVEKEYLKSPAIVRVGQWVGPWQMHPMPETYNKYFAAIPTVTFSGTTTPGTLPTTKDTAVQIKSLVDANKVWDDGHGKIYMGDPHAGDNQKFFIEPVDTKDGTFKIKIASNTEQCLDYHYHENMLYMGGCHDGDNQVFKFDGPAKGEEQARSLKTMHDLTKCLDYANAGQGKLYFYDCHDGDNQKFYFQA